MEESTNEAYSPEAQEPNVEAEGMPQDSMASLSPEKREDLRKLIGRKVKSIKKYTKEKFDNECKYYIQAYRNQLEGILPERVLKMDRADVNIIFPIIKTLIPSLYFKDPKVYVKSDLQKIVSSEIDPQTGAPKEYDGPQSAVIFQNALNHAIREAKLKKEMKSALLDAHVGYYGAIKSGWGNDQGVETMGDGAPVSMRDNVAEEMPYGIRLKPWEVYVDMMDFYNPSWIALRYEVSPDQLKQDTRLQNTDELKGTCEMESDMKREIWSSLDLDDEKRTEYFEYYHKPCASYPNGIYAIFTDEVSDDFLYLGEWPYKAKEFPVQLLYFNEDPQGGFPIPEVRYLIDQQKAKSNLRRTAYEYIQRTIPYNVYDKNKMDATAKQQFESGQVPRNVPVNGNPDAAIQGKSFKELNQDFYKMDQAIDSDITRVFGLFSSGNGNTAEFSSVAKLSGGTEQVRNSEKADVVRDHMLCIIKFWAKLFQQFGAPENTTPIDGQEFPTTWNVEQILGKFTFDIKPFSMNYEDPTIVRRQWVDLLNLAVSPQHMQALAAQGLSPDFAMLWNKILLTYDEPDLHAFMQTYAARAENQVADAINENTALAQGQPVEILPTDNDKVHIMIHSMMPDGPGKLEHIQGHVAKMQGATPGAAGQKPGGGNPEGLPTKGVAADQEMMAQPLNSSPINSQTAVSREAATETR